jgi:hypothetical protein
MLVLMFLISNPVPEVALACGSASISRTFFSSTARLADKLMALVVYPPHLSGWLLQ